MEVPGDEGDPHAGAEGHDAVDLGRRRLLLGWHHAGRADDETACDVRVTRSVVSEAGDERPRTVEYAIANHGSSRATVLVHRQVGGRRQTVKLLHLEPGGTFDGTWREPTSTPLDALEMVVEARSGGRTAITTGRPGHEGPESPRTA